MMLPGVARATPMMRLRLFLYPYRRRLKWLRRVARWQIRLSLAPEAQWRLCRWVSLVSTDPGERVGWRMPGMDLRFSLDPLETIQMNLYYRQSFQPEIVAWVKRLLVPEALFIDAGANVGIHALVAGEYFRRGGARRTMVYAFEPNPRIFGQLQDNIRLNGLEAIVMAQASGVADVETRREFYLSSRENSATSSLASLGAGHLHTGESVEIETVALSKFVERCAGGGRVGLLKLDVEGAELLALRGARDLLARDRPFVIMEVYPALMRAFGYAFRDARSYLGDLGYALRRIQPDGGLAELLDREWPDAVAYGDVLAYPHGRAAEVVRK